MNTQTLIRVSGIIVLAVAVSLAMLALIYVLQNPSTTLMIWATVSWNG
jgi:hypothetical protein